MRITIKNFRAIEDQEMDLAPITVVFGANGAGKSSLLYGLLSLKNAILNSNSATSAFFNYGFASLGGYEAVVFDHKSTKNIELGLTLEKDGVEVQHSVTFGENKGTYRLELVSDKEQHLVAELPVPFPYPANQQVAISLISDVSEPIAFTWNGISAQAAPQGAAAANLELANQMVAQMNSVPELLRKVNMVPLKRGFSKPFYQTQPLSSLLITEEEVATFLSNDKYLVSKVSFYLEKILDRDFRVNFQGGTAIFSLDATDRKTGIATELVNEGFGVNQMVYFLAKSLSKDVEWTCVEEPEIHLHPSAVRRFGRTLGEIVNAEAKHFLVSTHSEAFVMSLLGLVAEGKLKPEQVAFYFVHKDGRKAIFDRQIVHSDGQIEGGLTSFIEGELEDFKTFLKIK